MRIAQVAPLFLSVPPKLSGGTERVVSYLTEELVAQGEQQVSCLQREGEHTVPVPVPLQLREALREYAKG